MNGDNMKMALSEDQLKQLAEIAALREDEIDTVDIPEAPGENWLLARRPNLYRALKQPVTIRLDSDVVAWFKANAGDGGYQTEINRVLRGHVSAKQKRSA